METINKDLICRWCEKSQQGDGNVFDRFISLWIAFNAYYAGKSLEESEHKQLDLFQSSNKVIFSGVVKENRTKFTEFKKYIETKSQNPGFIKNLRYSADEERYKSRYKNLNSLCEYQSCVYQIRCNLFHGGKDIVDSQDEKLVRLALSTLSIFLKKIFEREGIIR